MGLALDILVILLVAAAIARGWKRGFIFQAAQLSMLVVVYFVARGLAAALDTPIAEALGVSPVAAGALAFLGTFAVLAAIGTVVIGLVLRELGTSDGAFSQLNRLAGTALGGAKGLLFCYAVIAGLIQVGRTSGFEIPWRSSIAGKYVADHNILDRGEVGAFAKMAWLVSTREHATLMKDPRFSRLMTRPGADVFLSPELISAIGSNDWVVVMSHQKLWDFLKDEGVQADLAAFSWLEEPSG